MASVARDAALSPVLTSPDEHRFLLHGIDWRTYSVLRELLDSPGLRMTYLEGALELMSPSRRHEVVKSMLGRLIEVFALDRDVPLYAYGSTTFKAEAKQAGLEPDECYALGQEMRDVPDVAIEVVLTSGGLPKLKAYERLRVPEVWFWSDEGFRIYRLGADGYEPIASSGLIASLDLDLLTRYVRREDQPVAVREYREALRRPSP
jgi:Uma2 family endonuclease